jgi:hypothetical protein
LIASLVEDVTSSGVMVKNPSLTSLPLHRYGVVVGDRELTNLSSNSVLGPVREPSSMIDKVFEVHQRLGDSCIDEEHSLLFKTCDQVRSGTRIEPEISIGGVVDYSWGKIVQSGSVCSSVDKSAISWVTACKLCRFLKKIMGSHDANGERQRLVLVEELHGLTEKIIDGRNAISNVTK